MQIMSVAKLSSLSYLSVAGVTSGQSVAELSRSMQVMVQQTRGLSVTELSILGYLSVA